MKRLKKIEQELRKHPYFFKLGKQFAYSGNRSAIFKFFGFLRTYILILTNGKKVSRKLEIGPGFYRIPGFETLDILPGLNIDYMLDATKKLPFPDSTFDLIYTSHTLEHVPWYQVPLVLKEWVRVLKKGGKIEIWVPDGLKISKAFVEAELYGKNTFHEDGWFKFNDEKDPCVWASGRIFTYGDGSGKINHPNWHRALFSPRYLKKLLKNTGLKNVSLLKKGQVRGNDHGWINLGASGEK